MITVQLCPLTKREIQVLQLKADGLGYQQIANALKISKETVNNHLTRVRAKLDAKDTPHAAVIAWTRKWIQ